MISELSALLSYLDDWLLENRLSVNLEKTKFFVFATKKYLSRSKIFQIRYVFLGGAHSKEQHTQNFLV